MIREDVQGAQPPLLRGTTFKFRVEDYTTSLKERIRKCDFGRVHKDIQDGKIVMLEQHRESGNVAAKLLPANGMSSEEASVLMADSGLRVPHSAEVIELIHTFHLILCNLHIVAPNPIFEDGNGERQVMYYENQRGYPDTNLELLPSTHPMTGKTSFFLAIDDSVDHAHAFNL